jgi:transcriptional regulator with XRE-family HTH domain
MYQSEAAALFGLSQSAYSRLENGETQSWKSAAVDGAAALLGITPDQVRAALECDAKQTDLDDLMARIDGLAAQISEVHGLLLDQLGL